MQLSDDSHRDKPQVVLYDERGDHIGDTKPSGNILEGGFQDFIITPEKEGNTVRPTYLQINHGEWQPLQPSVQTF